MLLRFLNHVHAAHDVMYSHFSLSRLLSPQAFAGGADLDGTVLQLAWRPQAGVTAAVGSNGAASTAAADAALSSTEPAADVSMTANQKGGPGTSTAAQLKGDGDVSTTQAAASRCSTCSLPGPAVELTHFPVLCY